MRTNASVDTSKRLRFPDLQLTTYWPEFLTFLIVLQCAGVILLAWHFGVADQIMWGIYYLLWLIPAGMALLITLVGWLWRLHKQSEEHPVSAIIAKLRAIDRRSYVEVLLPVIVMAPFMASFTVFKTLLENFSTSTADPVLSRVDNLFGIYPWQITHAIIPAIGTLVIDRMYFSWFLVSQLTLIAVLFIPQLRPQRGQVLLTFVISWVILGVFLAAMIPSVGPCYFGKLYKPDVYAPLLRQLNSISLQYPLAALRIQNVLWSDHAKEVIAVGSGVSAMPSMHVSIATITALFLRRINLAWLGAIWLATIWVGSVHLGWHYATDGFVSIVATLLIWRWVGHLLSPKSRLA